MPSNQVPVTMGSSRAMSLEVGDLRVHDVCFIPLLTLPWHSHGHTGLGVVLEGSFDTTWGSKTRRCTPATVMAIATSAVLARVMAIRLMSWLLYR